MRARNLVTGIAGAATLIAVLTVVSRLLGFGRWLAQAATVQASAVGDAYGSANLLPNVLYEVVAGGALAGAIIPLLAGPLAQKMATDVNQIASALLTWALAGLAPVALALSLLARPIAEMLPTSSGSDHGAQVQLTTYFLIVFAPQVLLYGMGVVFTGILQAHHRFLAPALAPIASTLVVIVSYLIFGFLADGMQDQPGQLSDGALAWLAWGTTAGVAAMALPLLIPVLRCGVRLRLTLRFPPGVGARARSLALAGLGALLAQQVSVVVVLLLARSGGQVGTINLFQWTQAVYLLPYAVLAVPLATAIFPRLAELATHRDREPFARTAEKSTRAILGISLAGVAGLVAVAPAVEQVFARWNDTDGMTLALTLMAPGVVGLSLIFHISRVLYALERNRAAVAATATGWAAVSIACVIGVRVVAAGGGQGPATLAALGLGHSIGMMVAAIALMVAFRRAVRLPVLHLARRTLLFGVAGTVLGAVIGRFAVDTVLDLAGVSILAAVLAGLLGGILALTAVGGLTVVGDRSVVNVLRRARG